MTTGGQELVDPAGTGGLDDQGDHHIHQAREHGAQEDAQEAEGTGAGQRRDESEGAAQENGALLPGGEDVEQGAEAGAAQGRGLVQVQPAGIGQDRHQQRRRHDGQQLLKSEDQVAFDGWLLMDVIHQFHKAISSLIN